MLLKNKPWSRDFHVAINHPLSGLKVQTCTIISYDVGLVAPATISMTYMVFVIDSI